jgi:hypothetical protein
VPQDEGNSFQDGSRAIQDGPDSFQDDESSWSRDLFPPGPTCSDLDRAPGPDLDPTWTELVPPPTPSLGGGTRNRWAQRRQSRQDRGAGCEAA